MPPALLRTELRRFDASSLGALAAIMQETTISDGALDPDDVNGGTDDVRTLLQHVRSEDWDSIVPVAFTEVQRMQIRLKQSSGGLGIASMTQRSDAAFIGRMIAVLEPALRGLRAPQRLLLHSGLLQLPSVQHIRTSLHSIINDGVLLEDLSRCAKLPAGWAGLLAEGDAGSSLLDALSLDGVYRPLLAPAPPIDLSAAGAIAGEPAAATSTRQDKTRHPQAAITVLLERVRASALLENFKELADEAERLMACARFRSQCGPGSMSFTTAWPSNDHTLTLASPELREALRRAIDIERPTTGLCGGGTGTDEHRCDEKLSGAHARSCVKTGEHNYRHHMSRNMVASQVTRAGIPGVSMEDHEPFVCGSDSDKRMDIVVPGGVMVAPRPLDADGNRIQLRAPDTDGQRAMLLDICHPDPTCHSLRTQAAVIDGSAALFHTKAKFTHYMHRFDASSHTLIPFVVEVFGRTSPHVQKFLQAISLYQCTSDQCDAWPFSFFMNQWRQRISVVLQRSVSKSVSRCFARTRKDPAVTAAPDATAYLRVRLLHRAPYAPVPPVANILHTHTY